jgi:hypothetical protein
MWDAETKKWSALFYYLLIYLKASFTLINFNLYSHIIDLGYVTQRKRAVRPAWVGDFHIWGLAGQKNDDMKTVDPMVARLDFGTEITSEEQLRKWAAEAVEKDDSINN